MFQEKISHLRAEMASAGVAGAMLTGMDSVYYISGYCSVMDGWRLHEPLSGVLVPTAEDLPITVFLPEAAMIGLYVAEHEGQPVNFERLRTFDLLNFCEMARAHDVHLELEPQVQTRMTELFGFVDGACAPDMVAAVASALQDHDLTSKPVIFDDMRMATRVTEVSGQHFADGIETMLAVRSIKTAHEIELFRESGRKADRVMAHAVGQLAVGSKWCDIEKSIAHFMIDEDIDPLPSSPMLFGGTYDIAFKPDLFRTWYDQPFEAGEIVILETLGRYRKVWIDINRTAYLGSAPQEYREQHAIVQRCLEEGARLLKPGANSADICAQVQAGAARELDVPEKLLMVIHSIGLVPLENPVRYPTMGLHGASEGFEIKESMVLSFDCLYFGSRLGPSHMENVFVIGPEGGESIYQYPLDLIEIQDIGVSDR